MPEPTTFVSEDPDPDAEPFTIRIEYRKFTGPEDDNGRRPSERTHADFTCRPYVNAGVLTDLEAMYGRSPNARGEAAVYDLFDAAMLPPDLGRFRQLIRDPDSFIAGKVISDLAKHLYAEYTGRPTQPPAGT